MPHLNRQLFFILNATLKKGKSILLLGPRQTGKTTLLNQIQSDWMLNFLEPRTRLRYERDPQLLADEIAGQQATHPNQKLRVIIDEVQKIPQILDVIQYLIDRKQAQFVLTGSSARKLKRGSEINLLPGRLRVLRLDPLMISELESPNNLNTLLFYGSLPAIYMQKDSDKELDLQSYVLTYLEEEIRSEAIVRNLGAFSRFLESAAIESGQLVNFTKLSNQIGVSIHTIQSYYQILEDCLIVEKIPPLTQSDKRHKLTKSFKYLFFDMGVKRVAAQWGTQLAPETMGRLFEEFVL